MEKTLQELAAFLHGTLENDDPGLRITGVNGLGNWLRFCMAHWKTMTLGYALPV